MQKKQVLLTGGTGGLGLAVISTLLAQGAEQIAIPYQNREGMERLKNVLAAEDLTRCHFVQTDLSQEQSVKALVGTMERVDVLLHLVGGFSFGKTHEYRFEDWKKEFDLNLNTTFLVCKYSLERMLRQDYGRIVTVGSRGAIEPGGQLAAYCAAKAGVVALTKVIADETKNTHITANVVLPSIIDTPANRAALGEENASAWVSPESLAQVIVFLASEAARDIRGAAIPVYGNA